MRNTDAGDNAACGFCRCCQLVDFAKTLHAHFNYSVLHGFVKAKQRLRHTDFIVGISRF